MAVTTKKDFSKSSTTQTNYSTELFFWEEFMENNLSEEEAERDTIKSILAEMRN